MDESAKVLTRGWLDMLLGSALLLGALVALCYPVHLGTYDQYGIQLSCGNGYHAELLQATINDRGKDPQDPQAPVYTKRVAGPANNYVDQCKSALAHRRAWTIPVAALGALIVTPELLAWARGQSTASTGPSLALRADTDTSLQTAELLDRRECSHRERAFNTTL